MSLAVCINCGALKASPFERCPYCDFSPKGDHRAKAQSLILSTDYYNEETDHRPSKKELNEASRTIRSGGTITWDESKVLQLIDEQAVLERDGSPSWLRVAMLLIVMFLVPLIALVVCLALNVR